MAITMLPRLLALLFALVVGSANAAHASDLLIFDCNNCYSPVAIYEPAETKFFAGGWRYPGEENDQIWATYCDNLAAKPYCKPPVLAIPHGKFRHVNDPAIVKKPAWTNPENGVSYPAYYLVYMTCKTGDLPDDICVSTTYSGHEWSEPQIVLHNAWMPTAVVDGDKVRLYVNDNNIGGKLMAYDGGYSGVTFAGAYGRQGVKFTDPYYIDLNEGAKLTNIDVSHDQATGEYRMLAENDSAPVSVIDELASRDGITWTMRYPARVVPAEGEYRVGTPSRLEGILLYASTKQQNSEGWKIYARLP